jgi:uncharacterized SAM-binding protein YcdF (DUF218 family)
MRKFIFLIALVGLFAALAATSGWWLVIDSPQKSDVIVVLAGETYTRPLRALQLFDRGYAPRVVIDVPANERVYQWSAPELAERWVQGLPQAKAISICPIYTLSTRDESHEARACWERAGAVHTALIVTSDFHTRRALSIFRHEIPSTQFSVAAAGNPAQFGVLWWKQREWAKTNLYEWMRLIWWECVDRWR